MNIKGTSGADDLDGSNNADTFFMGQGGSDTVNGKGGADLFNFGFALDSADKINGGDGNDTLQISRGGDKVIGSHTLNSVENIAFVDNADYKLTFLGAGNVGDHVIVDGSNLTAKHTLTVDAGNEHTRSVELIGGAASDHLTGGQADDFLKGGLGKDYIDGEHGADTVVYTNAAQSAGIHYDEVTFEVSKDKFDFNFTVGGVDDVMHKRLDGLNGNSFDKHLEKRVDASALSAHHAVVLEVKLGDWSGHTFLIVDANGTAGYQAGADYVIDLKGDHLTQISGDNFG